MEKEYRVIVKKSHLVMARSIYEALNKALDEFKSDVEKKMRTYISDYDSNKTYQPIPDDEWLEIEELFYVEVSEVNDD